MFIFSFLFCLALNQEGQPLGVEDVFVDNLISIAQRDNRILLSTVSRTTQWFRTELYYLDTNAEMFVQIKDGRISHYPDNRLGITDDGFFIFDSMKKEIYLLSEDGVFRNSIRLSNIEGLDNNLEILYTQTIKGGQKVFLTVKQIKDEPFSASVQFGILDVVKKEFRIMSQYHLQENNYWTIPGFFRHKGINYVFNEYDTSVFDLDNNATLKPGITPIIRPKKHRIVTEASAKKRIQERGEYYDLRILLKYALVLNDDVFFLARNTTNDHSDVVPGNHVLKVNLLTKKWTEQTSPWLPFAATKEKKVLYDISEGGFKFQEIGN